MTFPLWFRQKELLRILNNKWWQHHRECADQHKTSNWFHGPAPIPSRGGSCLGFYAGPDGMPAKAACVIQSRTV
jgi:hypothetical protein